MVIARALALFAAVADLGSGLGLMLLPHRVLGWMRVPLTADLTYVRFLGAFVAAVGLSYAWLLGQRSAATWRAGLQITLLFRVVVGTFAGVAMLTHNLSSAWWFVPAADFAFAAVQAGLLRKGMNLER